MPFRWFLGCMVVLLAFYVRQNRVIHKQKVRMNTDTPFIKECTAATTANLTILIVVATSLFIIWALQHILTRVNLRTTVELNWSEGDEPAVEEDEDEEVSTPQGSEEEEPEGEEEKPAE